MSDMTYETVLSELKPGGVRIITLNRPDSLNAMNLTLIREVAEAFDDANADAETGAIVFTGAGRAFCAGDDRKEHREPESEPEARHVVDAIQRVTRAICHGPKPVVGAINGWAAGGGFEWAMNCDFPIWGESAKGFFPEIDLNLFVTGGVTSILPALVGLNKAREMLFLGEKYDARALLEMGVAWRVVPDDRLLDEACAVAERLAALPAVSVRAMKRALAQTAIVDLNRALGLETEATIMCFMDPASTVRLKDF
jgi:enoyl-CoA hydratase/carnithine racemase